MEVRVGVCLGQAGVPDQFSAAVGALEAAAVLPGRHRVLVARRLATLAGRRMLPVFGLKPARPAEQAAFSVPWKSESAVFDKTLTLPPLNFTAAEMVAIAVSLAREENTPFAAATRSALRKVLATASAAQTAEAGELMDRVRLIGAASPGPPARRPAVPEPAGRAPAEGKLPARDRAARRWCPPPAATVPLAIQEAITARHVLRITYRDRHDRETVRDVEPVAFAATRTEWYLMAWCRLRGGRASGWTASGRDDTGEPASPRSYRDLDVDIPDALVRRPDLSV